MTSKAFAAAHPRADHRDPARRNGAFTVSQRPAAPDLALESTQRPPTPAWHERVSSRWGHATSAWGHSAAQVEDEINEALHPGRISGQPARPDHYLLPPDQPVDPDGTLRMEGVEVTVAVDGSTSLTATLARPLACRVLVRADGQAQWSGDRDRIPATYARDVEAWLAPYAQQTDAAADLVRRAGRLEEGDYERLTGQPWARWT